MTERLVLINGCSHAAGSEIDGTEDSKFNRENSFGNVLAKLLNRTPVNIAIPGSTNATIARSTINWIEKNSNDNIDLIVLVSWTDSSRIEAPIDWLNGHVPTAHDWFDESSLNFLRINQGSPIANLREKPIIEFWKNFIINQLEWLEIYSLNLALQLQYYFKSKKIDYRMCNSGYFIKSGIYQNYYIDLIDKNYFYNLNSPELSFYEKYKNLGYTNPRAKYWHHDSVPHALFAEELLNFYNSQR